MSAVVFYVSGHGFGHAVRQISIINALLAAAPDGLRVVIRTSAPAWLFTRTVRGAFTLEPGETDTGVVQIDSLRPDEGETVRQALAFVAQFPEQVTRESALLRIADAQLVIADAPPLACAAATAAGIPSIICANFTWDWIYRDYTAQPGADDLVAATGAAYSLAAAAWRMPMHGGFATVSHVTDIPFVARHAAPDRSREDVRGGLHLPGDRRLALVSFGGYGLERLPLDRLDCTVDWDIVSSTAAGATGALPPHVHCVSERRLYERGLRSEDLVRAVDVVVSKPGYGIISDCIANGTALLYTSRGRFAEYEVMVREMPRFLRCRYLEMEAFEAGHWNAPLNALAGAPPPPERPRTDGAQVAARMILERVSAP